MNDSLVTSVMIVICVSAFVLGALLGKKKTVNLYENRILPSVGIERIVKCNNTHSNWNEIVWIKR